MPNYPSMLNYAPRPQCPADYHRRYSARGPDGRWYGHPLYPDGNRLDDMFRHLASQPDLTQSPEATISNAKTDRKVENEERYVPRRPHNTRPVDSRTYSFSRHGIGSEIHAKSVSTSSGTLSPDLITAYSSSKMLFAPSVPRFGEPMQRELKLDPFGLPLEPQPLEDEKDDPLTWPQRKKVNILILISLMSFLSQFLAMSISPALWPLHKTFKVNFNASTYVIGAYIALMGLGPFLWNPLAHSVGRRPLLIVSLVGTTATAITSALARKFPLVILARSLNGFFAAVPIGLGSVIVCDLFYQHERGLYLGIYMVVQITGGHLGPSLGGYIYKGIDWHWIFYIPAIMAAVLLVVVAIIIPETLYSRGVERLKWPQMSEYQREFLRKRRADGRKLNISTFLRPFKMLRYPSIVLPSLYYAVASGYSNMFFITSAPLLFHHFYKFHTWQTGLLLGIPLTVGSWIGEFGAGGFSDWVTERKAVRRGGKRIPEDRLYAMVPGVFFAPLGLIIMALALQHRTHWVGPGLGIGIASAGFQIIMTVTYAYTAECYPRQTAETATVLNLGRQLFSFCVGFYNFHFLIKFTTKTACLVYAAAELACFIPMVVLMWKGTAWREHSGGPDWNLDL